jgi:hypothetical protein
MARFISELVEFFKDIYYNIRFYWRKMFKKNVPWEHIDFIPPRREHKK